MLRKNLLLVLLLWSGVFSSAFAGYATIELATAACEASLGGWQGECTGVSNPPAHCIRTLDVPHAVSVVCGSQTSPRKENFIIDGSQICSAPTIEDTTSHLCVPWCESNHSIAASAPACAAPCVVTENPMKVVPWGTSGYCDGTCVHETRTAIGGAQGTTECWIYPSEGHTLWCSYADWTTTASCSPSNATPVPAPPSYSGGQAAAAAEASANLATTRKNEAAAAAATAATAAAAAGEAAGTPQAATAAATAAAAAAASVTAATAAAVQAADAVTKAAAVVALAGAYVTSSNTAAVAVAQAAVAVAQAAATTAQGSANTAANLAAVALARTNAGSSAATAQDIRDAAAGIEEAILAGNAAAGSGAASAGDKVVEQAGAASLISSVVAPSHGWTFVMTQPTASCTPWIFPWHNVQIDPCPVAQKIRELLAFVFYILTALSLRSILFKSEAA